MLCVRVRNATGVIIYSCNITIQIVPAAVGLLAYLAAMPWHALTRRGLDWWHALAMRGHVIRTLLPRHVKRPLAAIDRQENNVSL